MTLLGVGEGILALIGALSIGKAVVKKSRKKPPPKNAIGKITMRGPITSYQSTSSPLGSKSSITPDYVREAVSSLIEESKVKGIIFEIDSPGGMVVPSKEIGDKIKSIEVPTVALVRGCAASGGYWIASACDQIVVNSLSTIGSIGVIISHINYAELADMLGVQYDGIKAGEFKDMGNPFREFTDEERELLQKELDQTHETFIKEIAANRSMAFEDVKKLASGLTYTGSTAFDLRLVDKLGGQNDAAAWIEEKAGFKNSQVVNFEKKSNFPLRLLGQFASTFGDSLGQGVFNAILRKQIENKMNIH